MHLTGYNEIRINQATLISVLQDWLDKDGGSMTNSVYISSVTFNTGDELVIKTTDIKPVKAP